MVNQIYQAVTAIIACVIAVLLSLTGCSTVTEIGNSSGCAWSEGGPIPGLSSGKVLICRSGKDNANIAYEDGDRTIIIEHRP